MRKTFAITIDVTGDSQSDMNSIMRRFESRLKNIEIVEQKGVVRVTSLRPLYETDKNDGSVRNRVRMLFEKRLG